MGRIKIGENTYLHVPKCKSCAAAKKARAAQKQIVQRKLNKKKNGR